MGPQGDRRAVRAAARRRRARRGAAIAALSTVVVFGGLALLVTSSSGWPAVRETFFSSEAFSSSFGDVAKGFWLDVKLFCVVEVAVLLVGLLVAIVRTTRSPALFPFRAVAVAYTDLFRGVPVIILVYLIGFGVLALELEGLPTSPFVLGGAALTLAYGAYVAEVFRAGILSVHPSQGAAALALGLTRGQALRHVILPQAVRRVVPPLVNDFIALQKDVALISFLGPAEAFRIAQIAAAQTFNYTPLMAAMLLYLCVTLPMVRLLDRLLERDRRSRGGGEAVVL